MEEQPESTTDWTWPSTRLLSRCRRQFQGRLNQSLQPGRSWLEVGSWNTVLLRPLSLEKNLLSSVDFYG